MKAKVTQVKTVANKKHLMQTFAADADVCSCTETCNEA